MDARTRLRRRVGDTPLLAAPKLAKAIGLPNLRLKMEGANPTGTQKDRIARLEVGVAHSRNAPGVSLASCGNFGVAMAHAAYLHEMPCVIFVPESFVGERIQLMQDLGAEVRRAGHTYEDAVQASRAHAQTEGWFDANPGGPNTLRTLAGYSNIAQEIVAQAGQVPVAIGAPIGNGSTLAGVHLGFHTSWAQGRATHVPKVFGGTSLNNNPVPVSAARNLFRIAPLEPGAVTETAVNEPLVNWDALDGTACLTAIQDSDGMAWGFTDEELLRLHGLLADDGIDAHPASLGAVAALARALEEKRIQAEDHVVAVMTSGRPHVEVVALEKPQSLDAILARLQTDLGRFGDPLPEMAQAVGAAFDKGFVLEARDVEGPVGVCVLTPMELSEFFPKFHLSYIAVPKRARGRGIGTILIEEAIRAAGGDVSLHVDTTNENAIRLYEKFGFQRKYYRMLYRGGRALPTDPASGASWSTVEQD